MSANRIPSFDKPLIGKSTCGLCDRDFEITLHTEEELYTWLMSPYTCPECKAHPIPLSQIAPDTLFAANWLSLDPDDLPDLDADDDLEDLLDDLDAADPYLTLFGYSTVDEWNAAAEDEPDPALLAHLITGEAARQGQPAPHVVEVELAGSFHIPPGQYATLARADEDDAEPDRDPRDRYSDLRSFDAQWTPADLDNAAAELADSDPVFIVNGELCDDWDIDTYYAADIAALDTGYPELSPTFPYFPVAADPAPVTPPNPRREAWNVAFNALCPDTRMYCYRVCALHPIPF